MSKKRFGVLLSLAAALILSLSLLTGMLLFARAEGIDAARTNFGFVAVTSADPQGETDKQSVAFVINTNLGENSFNVGSPSTDKVTYTKASGGTRTLKNISYVFDDAVSKLVFAFNEDTVTDGAVVYEVGDTLKIASGFTFKNWDGGDLGIATAKDVTITYTADGWSGDLVSDKVTGAAVSNGDFKTHTINSGNCIIVDFNLTNVAGKGALCDKESGWYATFGNKPQVIFNKIAKYIQLTNGNEVNAFTRIAINNGKIAVTDTIVQEGAVLILRKGLPVYEVGHIDEALNSDYCLGINNYHPVMILQKDLVFQFEGNKWNAVENFATSAEFTNTEAELNSVCVGNYVPLKWKINEGAVEPMPAFTSSDPAIATVDETGVVHGVKEGTVTITAHFLNVSAQIEITVNAESAIKGFTFEIKGAAVKDGKQYLVEYTDRAFDAAFAASRLNATIEYENGTFGDTFDVTAAMISDSKLDLTKEGVSAITVTKDDVSCDVPVYVYEVTKVDALAPDSVSLVVANDRTFYVAQNGTFDVSKVKVQIDYGDGFLSDEIALTDATAVFTLDTSAAGRKNVEIECTLKVNGVDIEDKVTVSVDVQPVVETYPDNLTCNDDNAWSGTTILIYFQKTFPNQANVFPKDLTEAEGRTITDFVTYTREGVEVTLENPGYLTNMLAFTPKIGGAAITEYKTGDTITLKKGLCFYKWFGETDGTNTPKGDGDFVKVGEIKYDVVIRYNAQGKFAWNIAPADGRVLEEIVEVGLGETHASNVETIPSYATNGEWFFTEENDKIAKVNANGLISGKGIGETTVTATLKTSDGTIVKTVTYKVKVTDAVAGLKLTSDKAIRLDLGAELDVASLIEKFGLKGTVVLASGAEGDSVDLTKARVTGYDADTAGEQTLTFRLTVDGKSVTGTIAIQVGKAGGCGSSVAAVSSAAAALLLGAAAIVLLKKKKA